MACDSCSRYTNRTHCRCYDNVWWPLEHCGWAALVNIIIYRIICRLTSGTSRQSRHGEKKAAAVCVQKSRMAPSRHAQTSLLPPLDWYACTREGDASVSEWIYVIHWNSYIWLRTGTSACTRTQIRDPSLLFEAPRYDIAKHVISSVFANRQKRYARTAEAISCRLSRRILRAFFAIWGAVLTRKIAVKQANNQS